MDIMRSPFFNGINWEAILARSQDGPMVPAQVYYGSSTPHSDAGATAPSTGPSVYHKEQ